MSTNGLAEPRGPRPLEVAEPLARLLCGLRAAAGVEAPAQVDLDVLHGVEVAVGFRFADDILAAWGAGLPALEAHGFAPQKVVAHCGRLRERGVRGDFIGVATDPDGAWAIDKRGAAGGPTRLSRIEDGDVVETLEIEPWVRRLAGDADGPPETFALHRKPPMADTPGRPIMHKKFGRGTAFAESGVGPTRKVTCDFPGLGLKIIQARFLEFLD